MPDTLNQRLVLDQHPRQWLDDEIAELLSCQTRQPFPVSLYQEDENRCPDCGLIFRLRPAYIYVVDP